MLHLAAPVAASAQDVPAAATRIWTLQDVLDRARQSDPGLAAVRAGREADQATAATAWSALSPRIGVDAGWTRSDDPALLFSQKLWQSRFTAADFALPALNDPAPRNAWNWGVTAEQPLWNGGAEITAPGLAAHRARAAREGARAKTADRLLEIVGIYVEAVRARDALSADSTSLEAAVESRRAAEERFRRGQVPELDTLRATAQWSQMRVAVLEADTRARVARMRLEQVVGSFVGRRNLGVLPDPVEIEDRAIQRAVTQGKPDLRDHPRYRAAEETQRALAIEATRATLQLFPSLGARADLRRYEDPATGEGANRFFVGVTASLPLWDGLQRIQERRAAKARAVEAASRLELLKDALAAAFEDAAWQSMASMERRDAAKQGSSAADEALRLAQGRYRAGLLSQSDLLAVEAEAARARQFRVDAEADAVLAQYRLFHAQGILE